MRPDTILVNVAPGETRVALLAKGKVVQVLFERDDDDLVEGAVFAGRVSAVNRDLNAAFVDIGAPEPGFLAAADARAAASTSSTDRPSSARPGARSGTP